jgi:hypothetical protein
MAGAVFYKHAARWQVAFQALFGHCMDGLISVSCTWRRPRDYHKWWTIVRSDSYSALIDEEEGSDMANFDANSLRILEQIEDGFRNQYWIIRNSRRTNWRAVNRTKMLGDFMYMIGVPKYAVQKG